VRHFGYLTAAETAALFEAPPEEFDRASGTELLSVALGATLYMPADRPSLAADIVKQAAAGVTSVTVCLEDSIPDAGLPAAVDNLVTALMSVIGFFLKYRGAVAAPAVEWRRPVASTIALFRSPVYTRTSRRSSTAVHSGEPRHSSE